MSRVMRNFREMLGLLSRGDFTRKCDEEMEKIVQALEEMPSDKGKATLTLTIDFNYELGRVDIDPKIKIKLPETAKFMKTPFWTHDGALTLEHPNQINMFPRDVTSDRDAAEG